MPRSDLALSLQIPPDKRAVRQSAENIQQETARIVPATRTVDLDIGRPGLPRKVLSYRLGLNAIVRDPPRSFLTHHRTPCVACASFHNLCRPDALRKGETIKPDRIFDQNAACDFRRRQGIEKIT